MTEEMDNVLRKSLDEVDRARKRQWIYLALFFVLLSLYLINIVKTAENHGAMVGDTRLFAAVLVGAILLVLTNILTILGLSLFINRMTNRILKAIELVSKNRAL